MINTTNKILRYYNSSFTVSISEDEVQSSYFDKQSRLKIKTQLLLNLEIPKSCE